MALQKFNEIQSYIAHYLNRAGTSASVREVQDIIIAYSEHLRSSSEKLAIWFMNQLQHREGIQELPFYEEDSFGGDKDNGY